MKHLRAELIGVGLLAMVGLWAGPALSENSVEKRNFSTGQIHTHAGTIAKILVLRLDGSALTLDRESWEGAEVNKTQKQKLEELVKKLTDNGMPERIARIHAQRNIVASGVDKPARELRAVMGANRTGMSTTNRGKVSTMSNDVMSVQIMAGNGFSLQAEEVGPQGTRLSFDELDGEMRVLIVRQDAGWMLSVVQNGRRFAVTEVRDGKLYQLSEPDFATFYRKHPQYARQMLIPALSHHGVSLKLTPYSKVVKKLVLDELANPIGKEEKQQALSLIEQLGSGKYQERMDANTELSKKYDRWMKFIRAAAQNPEITGEPADRLRAIVNANEGKHRDKEFVYDMGLLDSPSYMVGLLREVGENPEHAKLVAARLKELTGKDFGTDLEAWVKWQASEAPAQAPKSAE